MDIVLHKITFRRQVTGEELEERLKRLSTPDADWTVDVHIALLGGVCVRMLSTCHVDQTDDVRNDSLLTPLQVAKSTLITPEPPNFSTEGRASLYFNPGALYGDAFVFSFQRSLYTPPANPEAARDFVEQLAMNLSGTAI